MVLTTEEILQKIEALQSPGNGVYQYGLFPSQRVHPRFGYCREDSNIFFSALIVFTLQRLRNQLPTKLSEKVNGISNAVVSNYPRFRHYADAETFNFWQNGANNHFPNGRMLHRIPMLALPADTDDTSLIYLTAETDNPHRIQWKIETHYPRHSSISPITPKAYRDLRAYPTFLGKKLAWEMDACVISNVLYLIFHYQLSLRAIDRDSIKFLARVLKRRDYATSAFLVSPNYGNGVIVLYHIARLVGSFHHTALSPLKDPLIQSLKDQSNKKLPYMEELLIKTSLLRLKEPIDPLLLLQDYKSAFEKFYFFQAGLLTGFQRSYLTPLASKSIFQLKYQCEAYYWALLLEYIILWKGANLNPLEPI